MSTCSNTIFIGLPINLAIFGEKAVPYVLLYYIVNTSFFWTIGVFEIAKDSAIRKQATLSFHPLIFLKKLFTPALLGFMIGERIKRPNKTNKDSLVSLKLAIP